MGEEKRPRPSRRTLGHFARLLSDRPGVVWLVVVTSVFIAGAGLADPWLRKLAIDHGMLAGHRAYLLRIVGILLGLHLVQNLVALGFVDGCLLLLEQRIVFGIRVAGLAVAGWDLVGGGDIQQR